MRFAYRVEDVRRAEAAAMADLPDGVLMQRAADGLAHAVADELRAHGGVYGSRVVGLIGTGNNGADTLYALARLASWGAAVEAVMVGTRYHRHAAEACMRAGGRLLQADAAVTEPTKSVVGRAHIVLDGIVGIGGRGPLAGTAAEVAALAAASVATVVAVDVPSGVDCDTGAVTDVHRCVQADLTVTFGCLKPGLLVDSGTQAVGRLILVDIGLLPELAASDATATVLEAPDVAEWIDSPLPSDHKYSRGVVAVVAGSEPYPGAAVLCTGAARLAGVGMVRYHGPIGAVVSGHWPEVVLHSGGPLAGGRTDAFAAGPGLGTGDKAAARLYEVLRSDRPVVVDADGLTLLANHRDLHEALAARADSGLATVVTPHEGEFARLGFTLSGDRIADVSAAARHLQCVVLLKGYRTIVSDGEHAFVNDYTHPCLATAGSGDILTGLLGAMMAHHHARRKAVTSADAARIAAAAAAVHGRAGQLAARDGSVSVTAGSILEHLPTAINEMTTAGFSNDPGSDDV